MPGKMIEFPSNGAQCHGYLATPQSGSGLAVIVIQEWWGLVDHIKNVADRFAKEGFVALAPDLYHGKSTKSPDEAGKLFMALNISQAERDLRGAIQHVLSLKETRGSVAGVVGFCMGGQLSLYAGCANRSVGACVDYYGIHPNVQPHIKSLHAPVLGFFAENDKFVTPDVVVKLEKELRDAGKQVEFHIFRGADHAFFNDTRKEVYHESYARQSWQRMIEFFTQHLA
ncbi:MAG: dienelactone hydrolase family protein [Acidobacteriota bacterium]